MTARRSARRAAAPVLGAAFALAVAAGLAGCGPNLPPGTREWTGNEPGWTGNSATDAAPVAPPADVIPDIFTTYRFAPGDQVTIRLYGFPDQTRSGITIDADGNVAYLTARAVPAAGHSVAELRKSLDEALAQDYDHPLVSVEPTLVVGHRYYLLGKVVDKGGYPLDQPLRILDAIARARGIETGLQNGSTVEIADFDHSFLVRGGQHLPVDFKALIQDGDLRWNIHVCPGDVFYFPSTVSSEVYVYGAVVDQGSQAYSTGLTLVALLTGRQGLLERAYRHKIAVLRGNVNQPQVVTVDIDEVLTGKVRDLPLRPGDVIYVPDRPSETARELALLAARAFVTGIAGAAAGNYGAPWNVVP